MTTLYYESFKTLRGRSYGAAFGTVGKHLKELLAVLDTDHPDNPEGAGTLLGLLVRWFFSVKDEFIQGSDYSITFFRNRFDFLRAHHEKKCRKHKVDQITLQPLPARSPEEIQQIKELTAALAGPEINV